MEGFVSLRSTPYPPTVSHVICFADDLYPAGPIPLPLAEGGQASVTVNSNSGIDLVRDIWRPGACPPPDKYRGRGPQDTSYRICDDEVGCGRGRSEAESPGCQMSPPITSIIGSISLHR